MSEVCAGTSAAPFGQRPPSGGGPDLEHGPDPGEVSAAEPDGPGWPWMELSGRDSLLLTRDRGHRLVYARWRMIGPGGGADGRSAAGDQAAGPRPRREVVARPRLVEVVRRAASHAALTLVSAPAGFGKTKLLTAVVSLGADEGRRAIAWVSLDRRDKDAAQFWSYVLHALETASPGSAAAALGLLDSGGPARGGSRQRGQRAECPSG